MARRGLRGKGSGISRPRAPLRAAYRLHHIQRVGLEARQGRRHDVPGRAVRRVSANLSVRPKASCPCFRQCAAGPTDSCRGRGFRPGASWSGNSSPAFEGSRRAKGHDGRRVTTGAAGDGASRGFGAAAYFSHLPTEPPLHFVLPSVQMAPAMRTPCNLAPSSLAPVRLARSRLASVRSAPVRSAPERSTSLREPLFTDIHG